MAADHIHTPCDGRGPRLVYVDGKKIDKVFYADTRKGIACYYRHPMKLDRWRKRALSRQVRGKVEVVFLRDQQRAG